MFVDATRIPVIAADRGITAALCLETIGVQIGTAFFVCDESGANELNRQACLVLKTRH
ncbi:MAG: hypothetical protein CVV08_04835 [Gammaproteobacteria bacterium HGW-Gammaproteobacteria-12]|nr:MAG: hypothetical protein CVV08_04835 [Gammaproteobacteria bacterium HGW-Gammaproteobacteria-12]